MTESYTPGHSQNASDFMAKRTIESHGEFFMPHLRPGLSVLDCGCGPGSMTLGIAERCAPGSVVGVDSARSQIETAVTAAADRRLSNVRFETGDTYSLSFSEFAFDRVFSHALLEHLARPVDAIKEFHRVLKSGGIIGVCSPDWGGFILSPSSMELSGAVEAYKWVQEKNGGDVQAGRKLGPFLAEAGFVDVRMSARYECYESAEFVGEYLALQLDREGDSDHARVFREWSREPSAMFAQAWVAAVGSKSA